MPVVKNLWQAVSPKRLWIPFVLYLAVAIVYLGLEAGGQTIVQTVFKAFLMPILLSVVASFHAELQRLDGFIMGSALVLAWAGDISMSLKQTYVGMGFFAGVRLLLVYLYREMDSVSWGKVAFSAAVYSVGMLILQIVLWISETASLALQITGTLYMFVVMANGYVFSGASWWILTAGLLFATSDLLIAIRLVQLDWNTATIGFLDSLTYVLAMLIFAYAFVLERFHRRSDQISDIHLLDEDCEDASEGKTYQFEEKDTALEV